MKYSQKRKLLIILLLIPIFTLPADDEAPIINHADTAVFISTAPLNAEIIIDGNFIPFKTPYLVRGISPGEHSIILLKEGYRREDFLIDISEGEIHAISPELEELLFFPVFSGEDSVIWNRGADTFQNGEIALSDGSFSIYRRNDTIHIDPLFPDQNLVSAMNALFPASLLSSAVITTYDLLNPSSTGHKFSTLTVLSWGAVIVSGIMNLALNGKKNQFIRETGAAKIRNDKEITADNLYRQGEEALTGGNITESLTAYTEILENYRESRYFPLSLYKSARIHFLTGINILAEQEFKLLVDNYPLPEIYDKACKSLADLLYNQKKYEESLHYLDLMVFIDPFFTRNEIEVYSNEIHTKWKTLK